MMPHLLLLLLSFLLRLALPVNAMGDASSSTIAALWGYFGGNNSDLPYTGTYSFCVLEAGKFLPKCANTYTPPPADVLGGAYIICGLSYESRQPLCWGWYNRTKMSVPTQYQPVRYSKLAVGAYHVCGLQAIDRTVDCWGDDRAFDSPVLRQQKFMSVAAGWGFTCALTEAGNASCWSGYSPSVDIIPDVPLKAIYAGGTHACGIEDKTGLAFCWGMHYYLRANRTINYQFTSMALGISHSCGILRDTQEVLCWGNDTFSQVSDTPRGERFSTISAGDDYTCGVSLKDAQRVKCWGKGVTSLDDTNVSQGVCTSSACDKDQYELTECPNNGDRICLPCPGGTSCEQRTGFGRPPASSQRHLLVWLVLAGLLVCGSLVVSISVVIYIFRCKRKRPPELQQPAEEEMHSWQKLSSQVIAFDSLTLKEATNNYSSHMVIGNGSSGVVYKAILPNQRVVAIKKEAQTFQKFPDTFSREIELLSRLHHTFLTNLVGFCEEDKLLVYEFMENGSLSDCLFEKPSLKLNLALRIQIAAQAARALEYLHFYQVCLPRIIHRDVKSQNILLDKDWNAHVTDFGLSTFGPGPEDTHISRMTVVGTPGYLDPVYFQTMQLTSNSDVYSFGVVLMELLCGRKAIQDQIPLVSWVLDGIKKEANIFDSWLLQSSSSRAALQSMLALALECINEEARKRPNMSSVALSLEVLLRSMDEVPKAKSESKGGSSASTDSPMYEYLAELPLLSR